jgi:hypothetical protein
MIQGVPPDTLISGSFLFMHNNRKRSSRSPVEFNRPGKLLDK